MAEMDEIKRHLIDLKSEMIANTGKINSIKNDVSLMKTTLIGIPETERPGLVHDVKELRGQHDILSGKVTAIEQKHFKEKVVVGTMSGAAGAAAGMASAAISKTSWFKIFLAAIGLGKL